MTKKEILKISNDYTQFFKNNKEITRIKHLEYYDFIHLHVEDKSYLAFEIDNLNNQENYVEHSESVTKLISDNDSKMNHSKTNFISRLNNSELIAIIVFLLPIIFYTGFYFGEKNELKTEFNTMDKKINNIEYLLIEKISNLTDTITNEKKDVYKNKGN